MLRDGDFGVQTNELNTGFAVNGANLEITDNGGVLQVALADIVSGVNTDNQNLTGATLNGSNVLQIDIEDGSSTTVDLSSLEESADIAANTTAINTNTTNIATNTSDISTNAGNISTNTTNIATNTSDISTNAGNISTNATNIAANTTAINTNTTNIATNTADIATNASGISTNATDIANHIAADADTNIGNEYNTGSGISAGSVQITDGGGTESVNLISADANNDIAVGSDGALYLNVASVTISETITNLVDNGNGTVTYTNENGVDQTFSKSSMTDNLDGTYTFNNGSGPVVITNTDNQNLTGATLNGSNVLQIDIEDGSSTTVDLSSLEESADIAANTTAINTNTTNIATNTSDISTNAGNISTNTTNIATNTSDISTNAGNISTNATNIAANTTAISTNATDIANHIAADGDTDSTNELNTGFAVNGANLEITDNGGVLQVALADIVSGVNTDNQNLTGATLNGSNVLQIDIEDGSSTTVDLSSLEESADIAANTTAINTNTTNIATNTSDISTNAGNISTNSTNIATNTSDISTNAGNISTNATNIAANTTAISTNATDIANHIAADGDLR